MPLSKLGKRIFIPVGQPHSLSGATAPVVLGHEFSGEVVEIGEGVAKLKVGGRVIVEPIVACGKCDACKEGFGALTGPEKKMYMKILVTPDKALL